MGFNIGNMMISASLIIIIIAAIAPGVANFTSSSYANNLTSNNNQTENAIYTQVWSPLKTTSGAGSRNSTSGFFTNIAQSGFSGYAFIFPNLGLIVNTMLQIPSIIGKAISTSLSVLPLPSNLTSIAISGFITFTLTFIVIAFISVWMKGDILNVGS